MTTEDVLEGVAEWIRESSTPAIDSSYTYVPVGKPAALPDVVVEIAERRFVMNDVAFPFLDIQQAWIHVWTVSAAIMVDNSDTEAAATQLADYSDQLMASILQDGSLEGRVPFASPFITFDFSSPFVEYQDGTRGREMTLAITIGELAEGSE